MSLNIEKQMKAQLSDDILNALKLCSQTAAEHDFKIYLIGGIVRDLMLKRKSIDIDVTVEGDAVKFCHLLVLIFR